MKPASANLAPQPDDSRSWIGGEAAVGTQAEQYVRRRERRVEGLFRTVIILTFIGGCALGALLGRSWQVSGK
jgi:hypothetical protein